MAVAPQFREIVALPDPVEYAGPSGDSNCHKSVWSPGGNDCGTAMTIANVTLIPGPRVPAVAQLTS